MKEIPKSYAQYDPILKEPVHFVRGKTTYKQKFKVLNKNDFEFSGLIWFVLEPLCAPINVEFLIKKEEGKLMVDKTRIVFSEGYSPPTEKPAELENWIKGKN